MTKKNFEVQLKDFDRTPLFRVTETDGQRIKKPVMMNTEIAQALCVMTEQDKNLDIKDKKIRADLADRLIDGGLQDFTIDELVLIKQVCGKVFFPQFIRQLLQIIEEEPCKTLV